MKAFRPMMRKPPRTSPASTWREVSSLATTALRIVKSTIGSLHRSSNAWLLSNPDRIVAESKKVFEDVIEDFHSLDYIKCHFEVWRRDYAECYREAYIGLCLPKLFNPLVRLELIAWNPLEVRRKVDVFQQSRGTNRV